MLNISIWICNISSVNSIFPNAKIVIDKFHILNLVNRAFNQTRISIMNYLQDDSLKSKLSFEKSPELEANFNIYQGIIQTIKHNNFKRFASIVKNI